MVCVFSVNEGKIRFTTKPGHSLQKQRPRAGK